MLSTWSAQPSRERSRTADTERGSAVAEFALVTSLLIVLSVGLIQLAAYLHVRNVAADAANNGARVGALADGSVDEGVQRALELARSNLGKDAVEASWGNQSESAGLSVVTVRLRVNVPLLGILRGPSALEVQAQATKLE